MALHLPARRCPSTLAGRRSRLQNIRVAVPDTLAFLPFREAVGGDVWETSLEKVDARFWPTGTPLSTQHDVRLQNFARGIKIET